MAHDWNEAAAGWDDAPGVALYAERAFASLVDHVGAETLKDTRVLDFGCGTGLLSERLAPRARAVIAVDPSQPMIDRVRAKALEGVTARSADILRDGPPADWQEGFDLVCASSVLAFVPDYPRAVATLSALLVPGGWLIHWDWQDETGDSHGFSEGRMREVLTGAGLRRVHVGEAFAMESGGQRMPVLMGAGQQ